MMSSITVPSTEGIKYAGSKLKLLPHILKQVQSVDVKTVMDGFSGTTRVSQMLAKSGYRVICNDVSVWSETFGAAYLLSEKPRAHYDEMVAHLNSVKPLDGWFTEHYGGYPNSGRSVQADHLKKPWQIHNTRKLDGIREEIERMGLTRVEKAVILTSLILALDKVDNTLGHFTSYLKEWSPRSYKTLHLEVPLLVEKNTGHMVHRGDVFDLIEATEPCDLAYFDPPYGSNNQKMPSSRVRYAAYYHIWTSVCLFDRPELFGHAGRRVDTSDKAGGSVFEEYHRNDDGKLIAVDALERLIRNTKARYILLSYSSGGRAAAEDLNDVLRNSGRLLRVVDVEYKRHVMGNMRWTNDWVREAAAPNREFMFLLEKL